MNIREAVKDKKRIVIKIGSSSLMHNETGRLNLGKIEKLVRTIVDIKNSGKDVVLVSSGAIAVGRMAIGLNEKPDELPVKQACAAIGQAKLMMVYQKIFAEYSTTAAQVLMTKATVMNDKSRRNAQNTFNELLNLGAVPIVNENDTVSTYEIKQVQTFGDNDRLSAIVTSSKVLAQIGRQVKIRKLLLTPSGRIQHPDPAHLVHPIMADALFIGKRNEVVAPVLPGQLPRADGPFLFLAAVGFSVEELHHFTVVDGFVQGIDAVQQALAVGLGAALHIDLTLQLAALVVGAELFQLVDQPPARGAGYHPACLHGIHQQLELRQIKGAAGKEIPAAPAPAQLDVIAQRTQCLNIAVHALALTADALRLQQLHQLRHVQQVVFIGLLLKNAQ